MVCGETRVSDEGLTVKLIITLLFIFNYNKNPSCFLWDLHIIIWNLFSFNRPCFLYSMHVECMYYFLWHLGNIVPFLLSSCLILAEFLSQQNEMLFSILITARVLDLTLPWAMLWWFIDCSALYTALSNSEGSENWKSSVTVFLCLKVLNPWHRWVMHC